jgi:gliding motility-associated-like protein
MKKTLLSSMLFLLMSLLSQAQLPKEYYFFKGDTLKDFDAQAVYNDALKNHISPSDVRGYMSLKQKEFVRKKYNLNASAFNRSGIRINPVITSACNNLDFEAGNYTGWTCGKGYNKNSTLALTQSAAGVFTSGVNSAETSCSYHTLVNTGTDPYSLLPMVDPGGGTWALRLGGENINLNSFTCTPADGNFADSYSSGETAQQTFLVTPANAMFTYNYMVVLEQTSGGHTNTQCPYFRAEVLDNAGNPIPCLQYYVVSDSSGIPAGLYASGSTSSQNSPVYYSKWTMNALNLKNYINQNVTVRFTAAGCTLGGHFGYAYVDATCGPVQVLASSPEVCAGGTISLTAPGAGLTGTYAWQTMPSGTAGIVGSTTGQSVTINASGTYQVTVTQSPGCFYVIDTTIAFYPNPVVTVTGTNPTCSPGHDGTATANVTAGNTPYTYSWSPSGGTAATATGLNAGTYTVTITTKDGCTTTGTVTLAPPGNVPTVSVATTPASCSPGGDGTATGTVTGGSTPYTYSWTGGTITNGQGTTAITGLNGGTYTLTVSGPPGSCSASATGIVTQPNGPAATSTTTNVSCFGASDGTATVTATGGSAPLAYSWNPNTSTSNAVTGLAAGSYTCTTSDSKGCSVPTVVTITQPALLTVKATGTDATCHNLCNGGLICVPNGGGTPTYTYSWSSGCLQASCTNVCPGNYTATVTDAHGCKATDTTHVSQPPALVMNMFPTPTHCNKSDGKDSVTVSGGNPGYTYAWSPAGGTGNVATGIPSGTYTVIVHDSHQCADTMINTVPNLPGVNLVLDSTHNVSCNGGSDGSATVTASGGFPKYTYSWNPGGQSGTTATGLSAQTYTCTVTDSAGCKNTVKATILQPPVLSVSTKPVTICQASCTDLAATGAGGTPTYTYSWVLNGSPTPTHVCPMTTTTYTVAVMDAHGCITTGMEVVTVNPPLEVVASGGKAICPGGSAQLNAVGSGGNGGPYSYTWIPPTGLSNSNIANPVATPSVTTTYTVIVSDNCGTPTDSSMTTVTVFPAPIVSFGAKDTVHCAPVCVTFKGQSNPACASGSWNFGEANSVAAGCDSAKHCYTVAGVYTVVYNVTDINGCKGSASLPNLINALPRPVAAFSASPQPTTIIDPTITFTDQSKGNPVSWTWSFGDPGDSSVFVQNPVHLYKDTGCYNVYLLIVDTNGCRDSTIQPVCIQPYFTFYAPNTFTPNGDGKNDIWMPYGIGIDPKNYDLIMFDRWGNLMFETHVWGEGWDGRANHGTDIAQIDTYVWKVNLKDVFGIKHSYIGHCNIIR